MPKQGYFKEEWRRSRKLKRNRKEEYLQRRLGQGLAKKRRCSCCNGTGFIIEESPYPNQRAILANKREERGWKQEQEE